MAKKIKNGIKKKAKNDGYVLAPPRSLASEMIKAKEELKGISGNFFRDPELKKEFEEFVDNKRWNAVRGVSMTLAKNADGGGQVIAKVGKLVKTTNKIQKDKSYIGNTDLGTSGMERDLPNPDTMDITVYEAMRGTPQLSAGLALIKMPLISLSWNVECQDEAIARTVEYAIKPIWRRLIRSMLSAVDFGFASHEIVWQVSPNVNIQTTSKDGDTKAHFSGTLISPSKIKPHHPSTVRFKFDDKDNLIGMIQRVSGGGDVELARHQMFLFTHEEEFGNPFGKSRLKTAFKVWYWEEMVYQFLLQYLERRGVPPVIVVFPPGQTEIAGVVTDNADVALNLGAAVISNAVVALPYQPDEKGVNMWDIKYLLDDRRSDMFIEFLQHLDAKCLRALWVPERSITQDTSTGSYSMASVHADLFLLTEKGLISDLESAINENLIPQIVQYNFAPNLWQPCYVRIEQIDWNRKAALKEIFIEMIKNISTMIQNNLNPESIPDIEKMAKALEIPTSSFADIIATGYWNADGPNDGTAPDSTTAKKKRGITKVTPPANKTKAVK